jgi:hypothetical protein
LHKSLIFEDFGPGVFTFRADGMADVINDMVRPFFTGGVTGVDLVVLKGGTVSQ